MRFLQSLQNALDDLGRDADEEDTTMQAILQVWKNKVELMYGEDTDDYDDMNDDAGDNNNNDDNDNNNVGNGNNDNDDNGNNNSDENTIAGSNDNDDRYRENDRNSRQHDYIDEAAENKEDVESRDGGVRIARVGHDCTDDPTIRFVGGDTDGVQRITPRSDSDCDPSTRASTADVERTSSDEEFSSASGDTDAFRDSFSVFNKDDANASACYDAFDENARAFYDEEDGDTERDTSMFGDYINENAFESHLIRNGNAKSRNEIDHTQDRRSWEQNEEDEDEEEEEEAEAEATRKEQEKADHGDDDDGKNPSNMPLYNLDHLNEAQRSARDERNAIDGVAQHAIENEDSYLIFGIDTRPSGLKFFASANLIESSMPVSESDGVDASEGEKNSTFLLTDVHFFDGSASSGSSANDSSNMADRTGAALSTENGFAERSLRQIQNIGSSVSGGPRASEQEEEEEEEQEQAYRQIAIVLPHMLNHLLTEGTEENDYEQIGVNTQSDYLETCGGTTDSAKDFTDYECSDNEIWSSDAEDDSSTNLPQNM
jgi:hypothetical protein